MLLLCCYFELFSRKNFVFKETIKQEKARGEIVRDQDLLQLEGELNMQEVAELASIFMLSSEVNCQVVDYQSRHGKLVENIGEGCNFCQKLRTLLPELPSQCEHAMSYGGYQAERFGGKYIFFCPIGLTHFASPIQREGKLKAALLGGPVLMVDKEEFVLEDIIAKYGLAAKNLQTILGWLKDVPVKSPETVKALSDSLFIYVCYLGSDMKAAYKKTQGKINRQNDLSNYIHQLKQEEREENPPYPLAKERDLLNAIAEGNQEEAQNALNEILGYIFFSSGGEFQVIRARALELTVMLSRAALEGGADTEQIFGLNYHYLQEIYEIDNVEDLADWLSQIMVRFSECVFSFADIKHADIIYKAADYVKRHYMEKITLEKVAAYVYLSPSYFSKIFGEGMNCKFNNYLNRVRIQNAQRLLLDETKSLEEVAYLVGYEDQSYFSKVFKKIVGQPPRRYRETQLTNVNKMV